MHSDRSRGFCPLHHVYSNAIGESNMGVLNSFKDLPMYNFGVMVVRDMEDKDKEYLEQNIQMAIQQGQIDLEDAMAVRNMKDINQAERLLVLRRKKRMKAQQEQAAQNSQTQSQSAMQAQQQAAQAAQQQTQLEAQVKQQEMQMKHQYEMQLLQAKHEMNKELETIKAQATLGFREDDQNFKEKIEVMKEQNKSERQDKQLEANEQAEPQG